VAVLEPPDITRLQRLSRQFLNIGRDGNFWKSRCLDESPFLETLERRRRIHFTQDDEQGGDPLRRAAISIADDGSTGTSGADSDHRGDHRGDHPPGRQERERIRVMANWDPSYPTEKVSWYDEYVQRYAPIAVNWFQQPQVRDGPVMDVIEARGVALYRPDNADEEAKRETLLAVSPLDDGSVCLWDVNGTRGRRGAVCAKSRPGILFIDGPAADNSRRSKRVDSGVTECVSVDSLRHRAYFAIQSRKSSLRRETSCPRLTRRQILLRWISEGCR